MYGVVYRITNDLDGMSYIGQTTRSVEQRFKEHSRCKKSHLGKAIRKYGAENFTIEILDVCETPEQLNERERFRIAELDCKYPNGYNCTDGGECSWTHISEIRAEISAANSEENHHMFGKHHTDESKTKISFKITGRRQSKKTKTLLSTLQTTKHAVICIETKEIFDSVAAAARHYKVNRANIIFVCQNHQRAVKGFHLWYLEDFNNATEIVIPPPKTKPQKRAIICVETGEVFETIRQAAQWLGMVHGAVSRACRKHIRAGGYHWQYVDKSLEVEEKKISRKRRVLCVETGEVFESLRAAADHYNIKHTNICRACKNPQSKAANLHWRYADDSPQA